MQNAIIFLTTIVHIFKGSTTVNYSSAFITIQETFIYNIIDIN